MVTTSQVVYGNRVLYKCYEDLKENLIIIFSWGEVVRTLGTHDRVRAIDLGQGPRQRSGMKNVELCLHCHEAASCAGMSACPSTASVGSPGLRGRGSVTSSLPPRPLALHQPQCQSQ